jgi:hypothetical protein
MKTDRGENCIMMCSSPDIVRVFKSRKMRWTGHVTGVGEGRDVYRVFVGRPEGERPLGRPRRRLEDNIKMDLREIGIDGANWIHLAQDSPMASFCEHCNDPSGSIRKQDIVLYCKEYPAVVKRKFPSPS